ncbi:MAG: RNA 2',3'-cyclic phosphodiesterase [Vicinamibacterales bacterium]
MRRLFTAVELGEEVRAEAAVLLAELRRRAQRAAPGARLAWVLPERMHLTLRFIGEVGDAEAERIIGALRAPLPMAPFVVRLEGLGVFPATGPPRAMWIGVSEGREAVIEAESKVSERLLALGIPREARPYSPHLTFARVRAAAGLRTAALFDGLVRRFGETRVDAITLFQSQLSPKGPTHVVVEKTRLQPPGS